MTENVPMVSKVLIPNIWNKTSDYSTTLKASVISSEQKTSFHKETRLGSLLTAYVVWGKVIFSDISVSLSVHWSSSESFFLLNDLHFRLQWRMHHFPLRTGRKVTNSIQFLYLANSFNINHESDFLIFAAIPHKQHNEILFKKQFKAMSNSLTFNAFVSFFPQHVSGKNSTIMYLPFVEYNFLKCIKFIAFCRYF